MGIYDWTSRGPLQLVAVHAAVQWFASLRREVVSRFSRCGLPASMLCEETWLVSRSSYGFSAFQAMS